MQFKSLISDGILTAVFKGVPVKAAAEAARVARIASFIVTVLVDDQHARCRVTSRIQCQPGEGTE
jgi:hypothetical protein